MSDRYSVTESKGTRMATPLSSTLSLAIYSTKCYKLAWEGRRGDL